MSKGKTLRNARISLHEADPHCHYCGILTVLREQKDSHQRMPPDTATLDHVIPKAKGGTNRRDNLVIACIPCNNEKRDMSYDDFKRLQQVKEKMLFEKDLMNLMLLGGNNKPKRRERRKDYRDEEV